MVSVPCACAFFSWSCSSTPSLLCLLVNSSSSSSSLSFPPFLCHQYIHIPLTLDTLNSTQRHVVLPLTSPSPDTHNFKENRTIATDDRQTDEHPLNTFPYLQQNLALLHLQHRHHNEQVSAQSSESERASTPRPSHLRHPRQLQLCRRLQV